MKLEHKTLALALKRASWVVEKKNSIPILSHVMFQSGTMITTDLDMVLIQRLGGTSDHFTGSLAVMTSALGIMEPGDMIDLSEVGGFLPKGDAAKLVLKAGKASVSVDRLPIEDFPVMKEMAAGVGSVTVPAPDFRAWLQACHRSISTEEARYYLNGVYLHGAPTSAGVGPLTLVSTDGHRLGRVTTATPWGMPGAVLPTKAVDVLLRLLADAKDNVTVSATETQILVTGPDWTLQSKAVDGTFPDYTRVIPAVSQTGMRLDPAALLKPVGKLLTLAKANDRQTAAAIDAATQTLTIMGDVSATLGVAMPVEGKAPERFGLNLTYLHNLLQTIVEVGGIGHLTMLKSDEPMRIEVRAPKFPGQLTLIQMPMRV